MRTCTRSIISQLDVADQKAVNAAVDRVRPDIFINCAAYNNVDQAEQESDAALRERARRPGFGPYRGSC